MALSKFELLTHAHKAQRLGNAFLLILIKNALESLEMSTEQILVGT